jgi:hypothetical protein
MSNNNLNINKHMIKKIIQNLVLGTVTALVMLGVTQAQVFTGYINLSGTNSAQVLFNNQPQSNAVFMNFQQRTLTVLNIITNTAYTLSYGYQPYGQAATNPAVLGTIQTNLTAGNGFTNGGSWTFVIPAQGYQAPIVPWATLGMSNGLFPNGTVTNPISLY